MRLQFTMLYAVGMILALMLRQLGLAGVLFMTVFAAKRIRSDATDELRVGTVIFRIIDAIGHSLTKRKCRTRVIL